MTSKENEGVIPPPPGVTPNFAHPTSKNDTTVYVLASLGIFLCTLCLIMRIYTKARVQRMFGLEDIFIIFAWACSIATQGIMIYSFHSAGEGIHLWEMTNATFSAYQKFILVASVIYVPTLAFAKLSLLLLYHRLSPQKRFRIATYVIMVVVVGYSGALIFTLIFSCHPIQRGWDASITTGYCINRPAVYLATAIINIITDLGILVIPIPMVLKLKMPKIQKVGLMLMFVVGSATVITSIVRLVTLLPLLTAVDQSWAVATPAMWIVIEANLVIICGCLPTIRQFLRRFAPSWIGEGSSWAQRHPNNRYNSSSLTYGANNQRNTHNSYGLQDTSPPSLHSKYGNFSRPDTYGRTRIPDDPELVDELVRGAKGGGVGMEMRTEWPMGVARKDSEGDDDSEKAIVSMTEPVHVHHVKGLGLGFD